MSEEKRLESIIDHLYGELSPAEEEHLLAEAEADAGLSDEMDQARKILTAYRLAPSPTPPAGAARAALAFARRQIALNSPLFQEESAPVPAAAEAPVTESSAQPANPPSSMRIVVSSAEAEQLRKGTPVAGPAGSVPPVEARKDADAARTEVETELAIPALQPPVEPVEVMPERDVPGWYWTIGKAAAAILVIAIPAALLMRPDAAPKTAGAPEGALVGQAQNVEPEKAVPVKRMAERKVEALPLASLPEQPQATQSGREPHVAETSAARESLKTNQPLPQAIRQTAQEAAPVMPSPPTTPTLATPEDLAPAKAPAPRAEPARSAVPSASATAAQGIVIEELPAAPKTGPAQKDQPRVAAPAAAARVPQEARPVAPAQRPAAAAAHEAVTAPSPAAAAQKKPAPSVASTEAAGAAVSTKDSVPQKNTPVAPAARNDAEEFLAGHQTKAKRFVLPEVSRQNDLAVMPDADESAPLAQDIANGPELADSLDSAPPSGQNPDLHRAPQPRSTPVKESHPEVAPAPLAITPLPSTPASGKKNGSSPSAVPSAPAIVDAAANAPQLAKAEHATPQGRAEASSPSPATSVPQPSATAQSSAAQSATKSAQAVKSATAHPPVSAPAAPSLNQPVLPGDSPALAAAANFATPSAERVEIPALEGLPAAPGAEPDLVAAKAPAPVAAAEKSATGGTGIAATSRPTPRSAADSTAQIAPVEMPEIPGNTLLTKPGAPEQTHHAAVLPEKKAAEKTDVAMAALPAAPDIPAAPAAQSDTRLTADPAAAPAITATEIALTGKESPQQLLAAAKKLYESDAVMRAFFAIDEALEKGLKGREMEEALTLKARMELKLRRFSSMQQTIDQLRPLNRVAAQALEMLRTAALNQLGAAARQAAESAPPAPVPLAPPAAEPAPVKRAEAPASVPAPSSPARGEAKKFAPSTDPYYR